MRDLRQERGLAYGRDDVRFLHRRVQRVDEAADPLLGQWKYHLQLCMRNLVHATDANARNRFRANARTPCHDTNSSPVDVRSTEERRDAPSEARAQKTTSRQRSPYLL